MTIEVRAAEVGYIPILKGLARIVLVDSLPLTMDMVRQLKKCAYYDLEPIGLVRDNKSYYDPIVGRHKVTGELMKASLDDLAGEALLTAQAATVQLPLILMVTWW